MKALRYALWTLLALIVLAIIGVVVAVSVINPNDYKPQIEKAVESHTRLDLKLNGDIGWSLFPIGLKLNDVAADLDGKPFIRVNRLIAEIDFWSLLRMQPSVGTFELDGLNAELSKNKEGVGNWTRIVAEAPAATKTPQTPAKAAPQPSQPQTAQAGKPLQFDVNSVKISDAQIHYADAATGQKVALEKLNLTASNIAPGKTFPLDLSFHVDNAKPQMGIDAKLSAKVSADKSLKKFAISDLSTKVTAQGQPFNGKSVDAKLTGAVTADLDKQMASLSGLELQVANITVTTSADITGFNNKPDIKGELAIKPFSVRKLLDDLGQPDIKTQDDSVLKNVALQTQISGSGGQLNLKPFQLTLDDSNFKGSLGYNLLSGFIGADLNGDQMNVDRYLPPKAAKGKTTETAASQQQSGSGNPSPAANTPEKDLLPLDTLRQLNFDVKLGLGKLTAENLKISDIQVQATGNKGLIQLKALNGKMYDGSFATTASLDARSSKPTWQLHNDLKGIQTLPLLTDLAKVKLVSGAVNLKTDVKTEGNRISSLRQNANGEASFNIANGALEGMNLTAKACEGIARLNKDSIDTGSWPDKTPFDQLQGTVKINGNTLNNTDLSAKLVGLALGGNGTIDLKQMALDYKLGLRVVGEISKDKACRVNPRIQGVVIPVKCDGSLTGNSKSLCRFDTARFGDVLKGMATQELKNKANNALQKLLDKNTQKSDGSQQNSTEDLKNQLKNLFK